MLKVSNIYPSMKFSKKIINTGFLDTGGTADYACWTMNRVDIPNRIIYVTGAMYWKVSEKDNILFATIRNQIAQLHKMHHYDLMGCETNNYGRSEMESMRREYGIKMIGITTSGKLTDEKKIRKGLTMDKEAIIKFVNVWRTNAQFDKENEYKLGQIKFLKDKTQELTRLVNELDNFVRKDAEGVGATGRPKFGGEGQSHDDGPLSMLGNIHMIKTQIFKIFTGTGIVGAVPNKEKREVNKMPLPRGVAVGTVKHDSIEKQMLDNYGL